MAHGLPRLGSDSDSRYKYFVEILHRLRQCLRRFNSNRLPLLSRNRWENVRYTIRFLSAFER
jgi:hypothetical protein